MLEFYVFYTHFIPQGLLYNQRVQYTCAYLCELEHNFTILNDYRSLLLYFSPSIILLVMPKIYLMPNAWCGTQFLIIVIFLQEK